MSRYRGPKLRITRRLGKLPGLTQKSSKKTAKPGQHGKSTGENKTKTTEYGIRLEEKQKLKFNYGISEKQLYAYVKEARRRNGVTGLILLQLLEMRLDTICFSMGLAPTIAGARQLVNHGHITVNGKVINIPSFQCQINDCISTTGKIQSLVDRTHPSLSNSWVCPSNILLTQNEGKIMNYCPRSEILLDVNELLVIEYYSRR
uniref:Small ribosomal subunit protein uS4c n=1 Tax=Thalassiosira sp. TaxID=1891026 RepID=A0A8K1YH92_9STRA|nr:ribosomal protein S4 [Thalassiosira sp.]UBQ35351.1 ribosomal protein S4 [Thalassiosira sp.]